MAGAFVLGCPRRPPRRPPSARTSRRAAEPHDEIAELGGGAAGPRRERAGRRAAGRAEGADHGRGRGRDLAARSAERRRPSVRGRRRRRRVRPSPTPAAAPRPRPTPFPGASGARRAPADGPRPGPGSLRIAAVVAIVALGGWNLLLGTSSTPRRLPAGRRGGPRRGRPARVADRDPDRGRRDRAPGWPRQPDG